MSPPLLGLCSAAGAGLATGLLAPSVLRRIALRPIADGSSHEHEPAASTNSLLRPGFWIATVAVAVLVGGATGWLLPWRSWAPWLVLAVGGALLITVDAATRRLPNPIMYPVWAAMAVAIAICAVVGHDPMIAVRMVVGAAGWGLILYLVWWISSGQVGFGDVRLALPLGAAAGSLGWDMIYLSLLLGTFVGALTGLAVRIRRGRSAPPFAYGPALYAGCVLALLGTALVP